MPYYSHNIVIMDDKNKRISRRGVGRVTQKTTGYVTTSLRLLAKENRELRKYARTLGISFNGWAINTLLNEARKGSSK
jgi:hypothetical protein